MKAISVQRLLQSLTLISLTVMHYLIQSISGQYENGTANYFMWTVILYITRAARHYKALSRPNW